MLVTSQPGTANSSLPSGVFCQKYSGTLCGRISRNASSNVYFRFGMVGSSGYSGSTDSTSSAPSWSRSTFLISPSIWSEMAASFFTCLTMNSRTTAIRLPFSG